MSISKEIDALFINPVEVKISRFKHHGLLFLIVCLLVSQVSSGIVAKDGNKLSEELLQMLF